MQKLGDLRKLSQININKVFIYDLEVIMFIKLPLEFWLLAHPINTHVRDYEFLILLW